MSIEFGKRLRELREKKGLTQAELAKQCDLGLSTISFYESGKREPYYRVLVCLAAILGTTTDYLIKGEPETEPETPWYEKDTPPTSQDLEKIIREQEGLNLFGEPIEEAAKNDLILALRVAWLALKQNKDPQ